MKNLLRSLALLALLTAGFTPALQASSSDHGSGEEFKPGDMITHHISDAHTIHLFGDVHIPLPVILWTSEGLDVFMSSAFHYHEGHASHDVVERT